MNIEDRRLLLLKGFLRERMPLAISFAGRFHARYIGFSKVREYLRGTLKSEGTESSLLLLSTNRSATQFVELVLSEIYSHTNGCYIPLNRYLFFTDSKAEEHVLDAEYMYGLMKPKGFFYGQQGPFSDLTQFSDFKKVCVIRDPRDLVVSNYHSIASAHAPRNKAFVEKIKRVQALGLQRFAREEEFVRPIESALQQALELKNSEDTLFWRYEDMMADFSSFEVSCQNFINGKVDSDLSKQLQEMNLGAVTGEQEAKARHRRSGKWGQFKGALDSDVICFLDERFSSYLEAFDYQIEGQEHV